MNSLSRLLHMPYNAVSSLSGWNRPSKEEEEGEDAIKDVCLEDEEDEEGEEERTANASIEQDNEEGIEVSEDSYLKKLLLKNLLDEELDICNRNPSLKTIDEDTVLLSFLHKKVLVEFPPFKKNPVFKGKLNQLLVKYIRTIKIALPLYILYRSIYGQYIYLI